MSKTVSQEVPIPESVGPFRNLRFVGRGGMGIVYAGERRDGGGRVAVKTVAVKAAGLLAAIRLEVAALKGIRHPGIVRILEDGLDEGDPWYAMELLDGRTLKELNREIWAHVVREREYTQTTSGPLHENPTLAEADALAPATTSLPLAARAHTEAIAGGRVREVLSLYRSLCDPLAYIHAKGVVHRDLKPDNVFIRADNTPVLMDFGLVSYARGGIDREVLGPGARGLGTVAYVSPEQIRGQPVDARADLYAMGCMLYESLASRPPFWSADAKQVVDSHLQEEPPPLSTLVGGVAPDLDRLLLRLLAKRPEERPGHAAEVADVLDRLLGDGLAPARALPRSVPYLQRPRIAGRQRMLEEVEGIAEELQRGRGAMVLVNGESGVGKTFFVAELIRRLHRRRIRVTTGSASPIGVGEFTHAERAGHPLHHLRGLLQAVADHCVEHGETTSHRILGERALHLAPYESALAPFASAVPATSLAELPAPAARDRVLACLREVLAAFAREAPLVVILDDLQWADDLSLAFLATLTPAFLENTAVLVIGTYRSDEVTTALESLVATAGRTIKLPRLGERDVERLVSDMLTADAAPRALVQFLTSVSEGNPFFVAEYLRFLAAEGVLERHDSGWQLVRASASEEALHALPAPRSLADLVHSRLQTLSPAGRVAVEVASLLGRECDLEVLLAVSGHAAHELLEGVEEAINREIFERLNGGRLRFLHDKVREGAYEHIPTEHRRELHLAAATVIEGTAVSEAAASEVAPYLAHHYKAAGNKPKALHYATRAGQAALRRFSYREAISYLQDAIELDAELGCPANRLERARWQRQLGDALQGLGKMHESEAYLRDAAASLGCPAPSTTGAMAFSLTCQILRQIGHRVSPAWFLARGKRPDELLEATRIYDRLQQVSFFRGEGLPIFYAGVRALNLAESAPPSIELVTAYTNAHAITGVVPARKLSERYYQRAVASLQHTHDPAVESYLTLLTGIYRTGIGEWEAADRNLSRAKRLAEQLGFRRRIEESVGVLGVLSFFQGQFERALDCAVEQCQSATRGDLQTQCWGMLGRAQVLLIWGRDREALPDIKTALGFLPSLGRPEQIWANGLRALALYRLGDLAEAYDAAVLALGKMGEAPPVAHYCVEAYVAVAEVLIGLFGARFVPASGSLRTVRRLAGRACRTLRQLAGVFPIAVPRRWNALGLYHWSHRRRARAIICWERARDTALSLSMRYDEGIARSRLAHALRHLGRDGQSEAIAGERLLTEVGAHLPGKLPQLGPVRSD